MVTLTGLRTGVLGAVTLHVLVLEGVHMAPE
jgi:hypothetical protein